jgi:hypothetical protein
MDSTEAKAVKEIKANGGFDNQADAEWIVIRTQLRGHNDTPFGRIAPGRPSGPAYFVCFSYY